MAGREFAFDPPDRFVAGTVGQPGERTFYLQASGSGQIVSVALEKLQVSALAERLDELLDEVRRRQGADSAVPAVHRLSSRTSHRSTRPIEEEFRVGTLALAWDDDDALVIIEAQSARTPSGGRKRAVRSSRPTPTCCGCGCRRRWPARSPSVRCGSSPPAARRARSAATRSIPRATSARARTATCTPS